MNTPISLEGLIPNRRLSEVEDQLDLDFEDNLPSLPVSTNSTPKTEACFLCDELPDGEVCDFCSAKPLTALLASPSLLSPGIMSVGISPTNAPTAPASAGPAVGMALDDVFAPLRPSGVTPLSFPSPSTMLAEMKQEVCAADSRAVSRSRRSTPQHLAEHLKLGEDLIVEDPPVSPKHNCSPNSAAEASAAAAPSPAPAPAAIFKELPGLQLPIEKLKLEEPGLPESPVEAGRECQSPHSPDSPQHSQTSQSEPIPAPPCPPRPRRKRRKAKRGEGHRCAGGNVIAKDAVFRLGVSLIAYGGLRVSDVAMRLNFQPQEPRSLTRYTTGQIVGNTNYKAKFETLNLKKDQVPAVVRHFFPEGFVLDGTNYTSYEDPAAGDGVTCPEPTRKVGEQWKGSNGSYRCVGYKPCGCPGNKGKLAIVEKVSNRKKRSRSC